LTLLTFGCPTYDAGDPHTKQTGVSCWTIWE